MQTSFPRGRDRIGRAVLILVALATVTTALEGCGTKSTPANVGAGGPTTMSSTAGSPVPSPIAGSGTGPLPKSERALASTDAGLSGYASKGTVEGTGKSAIDDTFKGTSGSVDAIPAGSCQAWLKTAASRQVSITWLSGPGEDESVIETVWSSASDSDGQALFAAMQKSIETAVSQPAKPCRTVEFGVSPTTFAGVDFSCQVGDACIKGEGLPVELINNHACKFSKASPETKCNHSWTVLTRRGVNVVVISVYSKADTPRVSPVDLAGVALAKLG